MGWLSSVAKRTGRVLGKGIELVDVETNLALPCLLKKAIELVDVETEVIGAVDMLQGQSEKIRDSLGAVDEENYQESAKEQIVSAYYILDVLGAIDEILD